MGNKFSQTKPSSITVKVGGDREKHIVFGYIERIQRYLPQNNSYFNIPFDIKNIILEYCKCNKIKAWLGLYLKTQDLMKEKYKKYLKKCQNEYVPI